MWDIQDPFLVIGHDSKKKCGERHSKFFFLVSKIYLYKLKESSKIFFKNII